MTVPRKCSTWKDCNMKSKILKMSTIIRILHSSTQTKNRQAVNQPSYTFSSCKIFVINLRDGNQKSKFIFGQRFFKSSKKSAKQLEDFCSAKSTTLDSN